MTNFKTLALNLTELGYATFPCEPGGKRPLVPGGFKAATLDRDQIESWWDNWPTANPAIATGASGITVVDLDVDKETGECIGEDTWEVLQIEEDLPEPGMVVKTPRGGRHLFYSGNEGVPATSRRLGPGIDTRAETGYVLAPGAIVDGKPYELAGDLLPPFELPETPGAIKRRIAEARSGLVGEHDDPTAWLAEEDLSWNVKKARRWLEDEAKAGHVSIEGEAGSDFLFRTAAMLRDFSLSQTTAFDLLKESGWNDACEPPWSDQELEKHVENAYKYARRPAGSKATSQSSFDTMTNRAQEYLADGSNVVNLAPKRKNRFAPLTDEEIDDLPDPVWLVEDVFQTASINIIYGAWGSYKSFLAIDMACALAAGRPWQGHYVEEPKTVLYVAGEGTYGVRKRRDGWKRHHGIDKLPGFHLIPSMPKVLDPDDLAEFVQAVDTIKPDMIVFDTTAHAMAGGDENAAKDAGLFASHLQRMKEAWGSAIVLVHHTGKDEGRGSRGSTALPAAADTVLHVSKGDGQLQAEVAMTKQKDAAQWDAPLILAGKELTLGQDRRGRPITTLVFDLLRTAKGAGRTTADDLDHDIVKGTKMARRVVEDSWAAEAQRVLDEAWASDFGAGQFPMKVYTLANLVADRVGSNREGVRYFLRESAWRVGRGLTEYAHILVPKANGSNRCEEWAHPDWVAEFKIPEEDNNGEKT